MKALIRVTLSLTAAFSCAAFAADTNGPLTPEAVKAHSAAVAKNSARLATMMANHTAAVASVNSTNAVLPGTPGANPFRAYPPSCAADPLPSTPSGRVFTGQVPLYTRDANGNPGTPETVNITVWRLACSSSGTLQPYNVDQGANGMLLMRIDRPSGASSTFFPTFPLISSQQQTTTGTVTSNVRSAVEPNTVISEAPFDSAVTVSTTYVLENYPDSSQGLTYFNYNFDLLIDPVLDASCTGCTTISVPGYVADPTNYPAAYQDLPITGYMSSAWYDPAHGGEGIMVQIFDNADHATRTLFGAWYTYDQNGIPFWLAIQGTAAYGANSFANVPVYYYTGGGFAGDFSAVTQAQWGTMNISFPDCMTMDFDFNGAASGVTGGPAGTGSREFTRLADINALNCE